ncbi:MAG TPA: hypothetical protein VLM11_07215 [Streptosporangiaceae bacterium]|nr:hypothetical protein [Streptosporangiaceae bacterium]
MLVITDEPSGMRTRTALRAASRSSTTSTLKFCPADREHPQRRLAEAERDHLAGGVAELLAGDVLWDTPMIW